ncbi:MAG: RNA polymerase sigma factor [Phycisphaerae bacterium]
MAKATQRSAKPSDSELLAMHQEGDPDAFEKLVSRYRRELYNFLAKFTGDKALADDVFQEAFLQVYLSAGSFDTSRRLKPWLFTIAANKARDALRKRSRKSAAPLDATVGGEDGGRTSYADLLPADIPAPEEALLNLETRRSVQSIVEEMPENLRTVLTLSYFNGFAYKDISDILDIPLGTVKSRLHAAVKHFASKWKDLAGQNQHE